MAEKQKAEGRDVFETALEKPERLTWDGARGLLIGGGLGFLAGRSGTKLWRKLRRSKDTAPNILSDFVGTTSGAALGYGYGTGKLKPPSSVKRRKK